MDKWKLYARKSIGRRLYVLILRYFAFFALGAAVLLGTNYYTLQTYQKEMGEQQHKQDTLESMATHANQIIFRARGYYSFLTQFEYDEIFKEKDRLDAAIEEYDNLNLNAEEHELSDSVEKFFDNYFATIIPRTTAFARNNDMEGLRTISSSGVADEVNRLLKYTEEYKLKSQQALKQQNNELIRKSILLNVGLLVYTAGLLALAIWSISRISKEIGRPLSRLAHNADRLAQGETVRWDRTDSEDEIGRLSRSFEEMVVQLQSKEDMLVVQNEELSAQQDELQMQQEELQGALERMEENERYLKVRNELIGTIANTLDRRLLLKRIVENTVRLSRSEKGMILLLNKERDYSAFGISDGVIARFRSHLDDFVLPRLRQTKEPFLITRKAQKGESGLHEDPCNVTELFIPIVRTSGEVAAVMVLSRTGTSFSGTEEQELAGLAKQLALSLEKLEMHEETERQRQLTQNMLNTIHEGVQLLDMEGRILQANMQMHELMAGAEAAAEGSTLDRYLVHLEEHVENAGNLKAFLQNAADGRALPASSMVYRLTKPESRVVQIYCETLQLHGERFGVLLVHRDITHEYEVDQMKSEFVSTVSHELRTPLASVLGFAELLLTRELKPERQRKYLTTIHEEAKRLTSLINDFLDLQRMESGKQTYDRKKIDLLALLSSVVELTSGQSSRHRLLFETEVGQAPVYGDPDKLKQIFLNLVSNAVKYSPEGGDIKLSLSREGTAWRVDVSDHGLGIPADALPNLFSKFYRVDNTDRRQIGGTGLGLSIVKEIVHVHDGDIHVSSEYGKGSTFTVTLPIYEEQPPQPTDRPVPSRRAGTAGKVLVVEDDRHLQEMLMEELQQRGFQVFVSTGVEEAIQQIAAEPPDAVVLDLMLEGGQDGWSVIERMKQDPDLRSIPIFISSAFEEKDRAHRLGAAGYLVKPYAPHHLSDTIRRTLREALGKGPILVPASEPNDEK